MGRPSARLTGIVLWVPMLEGDDATVAAKQARSWSESRIQQWWDGAGEMSRLFAQALGLHGPAWDVYLLYRPGIQWVGEVPPDPSFWLHQLSDPAADPDLHLSRDTSRLPAELTGLLKE